MSLKIPEILAPAGSFASLRAAIKAGCDSVFFGISDFNMRATASNNFTQEDLPKLTSLCKENKVKTYLTLNTVMYDSDLDRMRMVVDLAKKHHVTAIIAADMATIAYAREQGVEVHISTQISISNIEGVKFYSQFSDRLVLARELRLEQVAAIIEQIKERKIKGPSGRLVEIEVFAHGALCVSVSGRCGLSLHAYDRSANKGMCTQICRKKYKVTDEATGKELVVDNNFIMSSADLCTIGFLQELVKAGVDVLKFEGRGRPPEYVFTVIRTYREALTAIEDGTYSKQLVNKWNKRLKTVFNRGLSDGFYMGRKMNEWAKGDGSQATHTKVQIGTVERYYPKINVAQVIVQADQVLEINEQLLITSDKTGLVKTSLGEFLLDEKRVEKAVQGDSITFKIDEKVRKGDGVYVFRKK
jgi:U32 family peptidase